MRNVNKGLESNSGLEKVRHWLTSPMYDDVTANVRTARRFAKRVKEAEMRKGKKQSRIISTADDFTLRTVNISCIPSSL